MNFGILGDLKVSLEFSWTNSGDGTEFQHHQDTLHKIVVLSSNICNF
jgi:hypothetical protein